MNSDRQRLFSTSDWQETSLLSRGLFSDYHVVSTYRNGQWKSPESLALTQD